MYDISLWIRETVLNFFKNLHGLFYHSSVYNNLTFLTTDVTILDRISNLFLCHYFSSVCDISLAAGGTVLEFKNLLSPFYFSVYNVHLVIAGGMFEFVWNLSDPFYCSSV